MKKRRILSFFLALVMLLTLTPVSAVLAAPAKTYYKITADTVKLRKSPSFSAKYSDQLEEGQIVYSQSKTITKGGIKWTKITVDEDGGKTGYIALKYMKKIKTPAASTLRQLSLYKDSGRLSEDFVYSDKKLTAYIPNDAVNVKLRFSRRSDDCKITVYVDGAEYNPGTELTKSVTVPIGAESQEIRLVSEKGGESTVYKIALIRDSEDMARLEKLSLSNMKIKFDKDTLTYNVKVKSSVYETELQYKPAYAGSKVTVTSNKEGVDGNNVPLYTGKNVNTVTVTSPLGTTEAKYKIVVTRAKGKTNGKMTKLEKQFVETSFQLLPDRHPFKLAYEAAHGVKIKTYKKRVNGYVISGVPFQFGGSANMKGFSSNWWTKKSDPDYPVGGLDCARYLSWIYKQLGYEVPSVSATLFFSGKMGTSRTIKGIRHKVITSLKDAKIGDVCYNSKTQSYRSGHGSHTTMFLGTARKLGIEKTIKKYIRNFPVDKYLMIDVGWADGGYYYNMMKRAGISGRKSMCGVGIQFFPSVKAQNGKWVYSSPYRTGRKTYAWKDPKTKQTFAIGYGLEKYGRRCQYKTGTKIKNVLNISRPIIRTD